MIYLTDDSSVEELDEDVAKLGQTKESRIACLKLIIHETKKHSDEFDSDQRSCIEIIHDELYLRDRTARFKPPPKSYQHWGPVIKVTWELPKELIKWDYDFKKEIIRGIYLAIKNSINECFSKDGEYVVSSYHYPHWGVLSTEYPSLHFHGVIGLNRFLVNDNRSVFGIHKYGLWENSNYADKVLNLKEFYKYPPIITTDEDQDMLERIYRHELGKIFGVRDFANNYR